MRLHVLTLVLAAACVAALVQMPRGACRRGWNSRRCLSSLCRRRGGVFLPNTSGCRGCGACVKFLGLGESCAERGKSTTFPQLVCSRRLQCDPETKKCVPLPVSTAARNSTVLPMKIKPRCGRRRTCFRCFCQRSRRPKLNLSNSTLHRQYR
ncbi:uncharacterized protein LOC126161481 [Schistocerca cancellata]|uniref:uncharacterized protein LOC126161481 n=1 Tax=Schistocerca cancellata TaxID=274614 RepID=UPI002118C91B|nr:uncharacterized protein LOC126161481 [Schistocerca cancellata]